MSLRQNEDSEGRPKKGTDTKSRNGPGGATNHWCRTLLSVPTIFLEMGKEGDDVANEKTP
jgi:hypothetical protein